VSRYQPSPGAVDNNWLKARGDDKARGTEVRSLETFTNADGMAGSGAAVAPAARFDPLAQARRLQGPGA
jgi:hypothetical protein